MLCWCMVSVAGNKLESTHDICKAPRGYGFTYLAVKDDKLYVSCDTEDSMTCGVYSYNILNPGKPNFFYQHQDLIEPGSVATDMFCVYVYDWESKTIHQLTPCGQLVTTHNMSSGIYTMFYDVRHGDLYTTSWDDNSVIIIYKIITDPVMPAEVLKMDERSLSMYKEALRTGKQKVYNIRVMVVGQYGVGKTTLTKRLLGQDVNISDRSSTEGIDVHINCCQISLATGEWTKQEQDTDQLSRLQRLVKLLNEHAEKQEAGDGQDGQNRNYDHSSEIENERKSHDKTNTDPVTSSISTPSLSKEHSDQMASSISTPSMSNRSDTKDTVIEILQLVNKDTGKLKKDMEECASLALWDFAGQYVFYTTHQTFLTNRAIYLLVVDLCQQITNLIKDDKCFTDIEGIESCTVYDLIEIWLNSIHSCTPSKDSGIPAVILVGTHMDKIPENSRQKVEEYFKSIYEKLKDRPTLVHIVGHIAIDNTISDPVQWEKLKGRIFEVAKEQKFWGEERPALWIPLEQAIMKLKASGAKVAPLSLVQDINRSGSVQIDDKELDLFLRFQHEIGTILFFSVKGLKDKVMLDPQWIIDALKSLITAEDFMMRGEWYKLWCEFKNQGKLTHKLLDVIWSKEKSPDFHDNKDYLLLLMEKLNIIARPMSYSPDRKVVKVEDYFLAPCMLRETTPMTVISPDIKQHMKSSSVLCFAFVENFVPSPIFHRLLAACVAHWPIAKDKNSDNLIYCGCCVFDLDHHHRLTVFFREHVILARVIRMGTTGEIPSAKLCVEVRKFIKMTLTSVIGNLGQNLQFHRYIRCPRSDGYSVNWLIKVKDLKKHEDIPCHCQDNGHVIKSRDMLQSWFVDDDPHNKRSHHKTEQACSTDDGQNSCLPQNIMDKVPSEKHLNRLSMKIGKKYVQLGIELGVPSSRIEQIQMENPSSISKQIFKILQEWVQRDKKHATFRNLEKSCKCVGIDASILNQAL